MSGPDGLRPRLLEGLAGSKRRGSFLGGVADLRFPTLLWGDREEELPEEDRERERRLRTGERLRLCLEGGRRLGGLLRLGEIRLLGLLRRGENDLERDRGRLRERGDRERERWRGRSLRPSLSRSLSLGFGLSSDLDVLSGDVSFTASDTESGFTSPTRSLVEEASSMSGSGLELSDWSGSCFGSSLLLGGLEGGKAAGLGFRRGEREGLDLRSRFTGERDFLRLGLFD